MRAFMSDRQSRLDLHADDYASMVEDTDAAERSYAHMGRWANDEARAILAESGGDGRATVTALLPFLTSPTLRAFPDTAVLADAGVALAESIRRALDEGAFDAR